MKNLRLCRRIFISYHRQYRFESGAVDNGVGDYRPECTVALYSGDSSLVNGALCEEVDHGIGAILVVFGPVWPGL